MEEVLAWDQSQWIPECHCGSLLVGLSAELLHWWHHLSRARYSPHPPGEQGLFCAPSDTCRNVQGKTTSRPRRCFRYLWDFTSARTGNFTLIFLFSLEGLSMLTLHQETEECGTWRLSLVLFVQMRDGECSLFLHHGLACSSSTAERKAVHRVVNDSQRIAGSSPPTTIYSRGSPASWKTPPLWGCFTNQSLLHITLIFCSVLNTWHRRLRLSLILYTLSS